MLLGHFEHLYPLVTGSRPWVGEGEVVGGIRELVARCWRMTQSVEQCEWQIKTKLILRPVRVEIGCGKVMAIGRITSFLQTWWGQAIITTGSL